MDEGDKASASAARPLPSWARKAGLGLGIALVAGGIAGYVYYDRYARYFQDTNDATIQADQVAISSKLPGYVRRVAVNDNEKVTAGALLVEIDAADYKTRLYAADAQIYSSLAAESTANAAQAEANAAVGTAQANLEAARKNLEFAEREVARYKPLVAKGAEPAGILSQRIATRDRASADVAAAESALAQAQSRVESAAAQVRQQRAQVVASRVQYQAAANDMGSTRLTAPIAGRIASRSVRVGQFIQPGVRLMTIVPDQDLYVLANFKETQVGLMQPGQPVRIRADALPGVTFRGQVTSVTPGTGANFSLIPPQNATGNFTKIVQRVPVRIRIDAGPAARRVLVPGLSLEVEVDTRGAKGTLDAIRAEQEKGR